jgi:acyl-CoA synthetase (AMP-forming)/AMP-acid ligase II
MDVAFLLGTMARRGLLKPGRPVKIGRQLSALRRYGFGLGGELRSAAARYPDRVAVVDDSGARTYAQLLRRAERLAGGLRGTLGLGNDPQAADRLGIMCRNHGGAVEAMVAASMLGIDAVLVNTGSSAAQLATVAQEQQLRAIVHDLEFAGHVTALPREVARVSEERLSELVWQSDNRTLDRPARDGRVIVLTSGTTGAPKGARRPLPGGFSALATVISRIPLNAGDRALIAAPLFHTWGYAALQLCLGVAGTMVLTRRFDPADTLDTIADERCTVLFAVPVMLQRMLEVPVRRTPLRVVAVSGSALRGGLASRFMDVYSEVLYNLYGSTEVSWASIATPDELRHNPATAGRPPRGTRIAILDGHGNPLPTGHTGRIFVGNEMLFEGYTHHTHTADTVHDGLLDTGDLGHLDADGLLEVDGRADDMVISGGENVYPSQVEELLAALPQVREVAVVGVDDDEYGQRLVAFLALHHGERLDADAVCEYVRLRLARFYVPRDVRFVAALPRNATGKVVPRQLPW